MNTGQFVHVPIPADSNPRIRSHNSSVCDLQNEPNCSTPDGPDHRTRNLASKSQPLMTQDRKLIATLKSRRRGAENTAWTKTRPCPFPNAYVPPIEPDKTAPYANASNEETTEHCHTVAYASVESETSCLSNEPKTTLSES